MKEKWDERYSKNEFAYGEEPNDYLKKQLTNLTAGTILFPAEGEGRNAVYAATLGWMAYAFDLSEEGKKKATALANKHNVEIDYTVGEFQSLTYPVDKFDAIALIYAHFPGDLKSRYHRRLTTYLKPGGLVIFEAFSKKHLDYMARDEKMGGPKEISMLFSTEEIMTDFNGFDVVELSEQEITLREGPFHNGTGSVIRFTGRKK